MLTHGASPCASIDPPSPQEPSQDESRGDLRDRREVSWWCWFAVVVKVGREVEVSSNKVGDDDRWGVYKVVVDPCTPLGCAPEDEGEVVEVFSTVKGEAKGERGREWTWLVWSAKGVGSGVGGLTAMVDVVAPGERSVSCPSPATLAPGEGSVSRSWVPGSPPPSASTSRMRPAVPTESSPDRIPISTTARDNKRKTCVAPLSWARCRSISTRNCPTS